MNFRIISLAEEKLVQKKIDLKFGNRVFERIKNDFKLIIGEGILKEIFLVPNQMVEIFEKLKELDSIYHLGIHFISMSRKQLKFHPSSIYLISKYTKKYIIVTRKGEQTALYGRNIPISLLKKVEIQAKKGEFVVIQNKKNEALAIGWFLVDSESISKISNPNTVVIKVISDLGWYLREGK